jgi:hypothetical protein
MNRKSVTIGNRWTSYRIHAGRLQEWLCRLDRNPYNEENYAWHDTWMRVGAECVLVSHTDVSVNALRSGMTNRQRTAWTLSRSVLGIPGNSNPAILRLHGWRGTSGDCQVNAHGRRRIVNVHTTKSGRVVVVVGRDIAPDEA